MPDNKRGVVNELAPPTYNVDSNHVTYLFSVHILSAPQVGGFTNIFMTTLPVCHYVSH